MSDARPAEWNAKRVARLRRHLGETQQAFGTRLGTRQQTVSEWETGASRPQRMSRRLLHLVAEEAGFTDASAAAAEPHDAEPGDADARDANATDVEPEGTPGERPAKREP